MYSGNTPEPEREQLLNGQSITRVINLGPGKPVWVQIGPVQLAEGVELWVDKETRELPPISPERLAAVRAVKPGESRTYVGAIVQPEELVLVEASYGGPTRPGISIDTLIAAEINFSDHPEPGSIEIPYWTADGDLTRFKRWRLPSVRADGQKYHQEPGSGVYAYYPPGFFPHHHVADFGLADHSVVLIEGEFKALAMNEAGVYAIGIPSFTVYQKDENGYRQLLDDLRRIFDHEGIKTIYFIGDADTATNFEFSRSAAFLARNAWQAKVFLPRIPFDAPKGIDDCKAAMGAQFGAFFTGLVKDAVVLDRNGDETALALLLFQREQERIKVLLEKDFARQSTRIVRLVSAALFCGRTAASAQLRKAAAKLLAIGLRDLDEAIKTERGKSKESAGEKTTKREQGPKESRSQLILPGHHVEFQECGRNCFPALAKTERYFVRDRIVFELIKDSLGARLSQLKPEAFRSQLEEYFRLCSWVNVSGKLRLLDGRCSVADATALLKCDPAWEFLPPIQLVTASPVFAAANGELKILGKGYHPVLGGIYISRDYKIIDVTLQDAVIAIKSLAKDFLFVAAADKSRFLAGLIAPALRFGGLVKADFPVFINEADKSQAGKTYGHKVLCRIYNERPFTITLSDERNAIGSHEEKLSKGLIECHAFIMWENVRERIASQLAESAIRGTGSVTCRVAYLAPVEVPTDKVMWLLSSNKASMTSDLAARALITRLRKQPDTYTFQKFDGERDLLKEVGHNCAYYLSCILSIVRAWFEQGCPQHIFQLAPLLDDHQNEQERISNPLLNWLRDLALLVEKSEKLEEWLRASEIANICADHNLMVPQCHVDADDKARNQAVGRVLKNLFKGAPSLSVSGFAVERKTFDEYDPVHQENLEVTRHCFEKT
jgi:Domain of unknown function (DUF3854)